MVPLDTEVFVQNVKRVCTLRGIAPTVACRESGAGKSLLNDISRGRVPSVEKVQQLAQYLGVTTSELLGEVPDPLAMDGPALEFTKLWLSLPAESREQIIAAMLTMRGR